MSEKQKKKEFDCATSAMFYLQNEMKDHKWKWENKMGFMSCGKVKNNVDNYIEALKLIEQKIDELEQDLEAVRDY